MEHLNLLSNRKLSSFLTFLTQEVTTLPGVKLVGPLAQGTKVRSDLASWPAVYVDGGVDFKEFYPAPQALALGDGDSSKDRAEALDLLYPQDKDDTDLALALNILEEVALPIRLIGFTGGRREHEFALIGDVFSFIKKAASPAVYWDDHAFFLPPGTHRLEGTGSFSLFTLESTLVRLSGHIRYSADPAKPFRALSGLGISNEAQGQFEVAATRPTLLTWAADAELFRLGQRSASDIRPLKREGAGF